MRAVHLQCEYMTEPMGIDCQFPLLLWNCEDGVRQSAYEVRAVTDSGALLWESGQIKSSSMRTVWGGPAVPAETRVIWSVRLYDENGRSGEETTASFETGLPAGQKWPAEWITGNYRVDPKKRYPADCFQKTFRVPEEGIVKARLYITACGLYEARINGKKAGDLMMTPGITDYRKRIAYQTIDVTGLVRGGMNVIEAEFADGWYRGSCGAWGRKNQYGKETALLAMLKLYLKDGTERIVSTNGSWEWSCDGPVRFADNKDGEIIEAGRVPPYRGRAKVTRRSVIPSAGDNVPVRAKEHLRATLLVTPSGKKVLDFHQNIAGILAFSIEAEEGKTIIFRFGEMLDENGEFTQRNIQCKNKHVTTPLQRVIYTCRAGRNDYRTRFAVFGFQYVLVEGLDDVNPDDFEAVSVRSDLEETGEFSCDNELLNQFVKNTIWSARNNSLDIPTDCPTRERHGWTGDAQIFAPTECFLFEAYPFERKFLRDMYDQQKRNGCLPQIAPPGGVDFYMKAMDGSVGWADAGVIIPYVLWKQYGDARILREFLPGMRRYFHFMQRRCGKWYPTAQRTGLSHAENKYISNFGQAYGEWAEPADIHAMTWKDCAVPHPEVATAYTAYIAGLMSEIETALGHTDKAKAAADFRRHCVKSYEALSETKEFTLDTDRQARLVRPLAFGLLNEQQTEYARKRLLEALRHYGFRVGTGFLSTPLIMDVLSAYDLEAAYRLLENEELPGWLSMPKNGATTVWEAWEGPASGDSGIGSLDHYSKGAVVRWLFDGMCGIHVAGENQFRIEPRPGGHFKQARASYRSVYGTVVSGWKKTDEGISFLVTVPANCEAEVVLPDGRAVRQTAGTREYAWKEQL